MQYHLLSRGINNSMKIILFDLGDTLEHNDVLLPGATETLSEIETIKDDQNQPVVLALISDFRHANNQNDQNEIKAIRQEYYEIVDNLGIRSFFRPEDVRITLSTDIGINKAEKEIFMYAIDKVSKGLSFNDVIFITEKKIHVDAVREFSPVPMNAIHFKGPGQNEGEVENLIELVPKIKEMVQSIQ